MQRDHTEPNFDWLLYLVLLLAIAYAAITVGGEIREAWQSLGQTLDKVVP